MVVLEGDFDKIHAVPPTFIKLFTLTRECAQGHFIQWVRGDVLHKNNSAWKFVLDVDMELINQKFGAFARNLGCYFDLSELKFDFLHHGLQLLFKVRLVMKDEGLRMQPNDSSLFIEVN